MRSNQHICKHIAKAPQAKEPILPTFGMLFVIFLK